MRCISIYIYYLYIYIYGIAIRNGKKLKKAAERKADKKKAAEQDAAPKSSGNPMMDALAARLKSMRKDIEPSKVT